MALPALLTSSLLTSSLLLLRSTSANTGASFSPPSDVESGFEPSPFQSLLAKHSGDVQIQETSGSSPMVTRVLPDEASVLQRSPRQSSEPTQGGVDFSQATRQPDGRLCVIKEASVETVSKDPILECKHKDVEKCHYTYVTVFKAAQEETCEENFEKKCQITFRQEAIQETVRKCYRPVEKVCNGQGPEQCKTVYESSCTTKYIDEGNGKFVGDTRCEKKPVKICGAGCITEEGPEECHNKVLDTLVDVPEEMCDLNPQKTCRLVTKLVPSLQPKEECTIVPKETCALKFTQPKRTDKPLRTEWCLDEEAAASEPQAEYGGAGSARRGRIFVAQPVSSFPSRSFSSATNQPTIISSNSQGRTFSSTSSQPTTIISSSPSRSFSSTGSGQPTTIISEASNAIASSTFASQPTSTILSQPRSSFSRQTSTTFRQPPSSPPVGSQPFVRTQLRGSG